MTDRRVLAGAGSALLVLLVACGSKDGETAKLPGGIAPPTAIHENKNCTPKPCEVGKDGVEVYVSNVTRYESGTDTVVSFDFRVVNGSSYELGFIPRSAFSEQDATGAGFDHRAGPTSGNPNCWPDDDHTLYHLQSGESLTGPHALCYYVPAGTKVVAVRFADENGEPEIVAITPV